jgi:hypothetical protein
MERKVLAERESARKQYAQKIIEQSEEASEGDQRDFKAQTF